MYGAQQQYNATQSDACGSATPVHDTLKDTGSASSGVSGTMLSEAGRAAVVDVLVGATDGDGESL